MKRLIYFITTILACGGLVFAQTVPAFALDTLGGQKIINETNKLENHFQNQASKSATKSANQLQNIITKADILITNRLNSLTELSNRIQNDTRLSANEKSMLIADIQKDVSGLMALKAKIDADTDAATAKTDAKQIITNYYVYMIFEPKERLLVTLNNMQTTVGYVQALVPQIQNLINTLKSQGKDVSQLQPLLDDVSSQLKTIETTIATDISTVQNVSTTDHSSAKTAFQKVKQDISQIVKSGFAKIRTDFANMRPLFKDIIGTGGGTPSPSKPVATSMPRPACLDATPRCLIAEPASGWCPTTPTASVSETPSTSPAPTQ